MEVLEGKHFWHEVAVGAYLLSKADGETVWKVVAERPGEVLLQQRDGHSIIVPRPGPFEPVTFMVRTLEECEAMLEAELGATLLARKEKGTIHAGPLGTDRTQIKTHFGMLHGIQFGSDKTPTKQMIVMHDEIHADAARGLETHGYVHHEHVPLRPLGVRR